MMTQEEIDNTIVDVVFDDNQIYHVLYPDLEGIRGIPYNQKIIRDNIATIKDFLSNLDQEKIVSFENELKNLSL